MIIPIGHDRSIRQHAYLTIGIIVLCTLIQIYSSFFAPSVKVQSAKLDALAEEYSAKYGTEPTPDQVAELAARAEDILDEMPQFRFGYLSDSGLSINLLTAAFVHEGWIHLIGNMLFLWLAGSALEDRYGKLRFGVFYLLGAAAANYAFALTTGDEQVLLIGASGAVSACMGAFLMHFHRTQITFWYWFYRSSGTFQWPAWFALPLWLAEQFLWNALDKSPGGVAYGAHIGGFVFGAVAALVMGKLFPGDADNDDVVYNETAPAAALAPRASDAEVDGALEERVTRLLAALETRDVANVKTLSSRVIIDLARNKSDARVVEIYHAIADQMSKVPLTVGAFAAAAASADSIGDTAAYIAIANAMIAEQPYGMQTPQVMWRMSQLHGDAGNHDLEQATLRTLAERFPKDAYGRRAAASLA